MKFPRDGGLSCVWYYLTTRRDGLEDYALEQLSTPGRTAGHIQCVCGAVEDWTILVPQKRGYALAVCLCSGSSLPIYVGAPPPVTEPDEEERTSARCDKGHEGSYSAVVAIGYPGRVPQLGTLDVERAQEVVLATQCRLCSQMKIAWELRLPEPPLIVGDEPWIASIQGLQRR